MYVIKTRQNPVTRELIALAQVYGVAPRFVATHDARGRRTRCAEFRLKDGGQLDALAQFLVTQGFQATMLRRRENEVDCLVIPAAVDA